MKRINVAIIGQGRSGRDIHGAYFHRVDNKYYDVKFIVDADEYRRNLALTEYPGCTAFADYTELFAHRDEIDLVVNSSYSNDHYPISKDLMVHGFNVLCEKPLASTTYEVDDLIKTSKQYGVKLAVFHQTLYTPYYQKAKEIVDSKLLGDVQQIDLQYNGFARRWDWQTLQKRNAGNTNNSGPHPISVALALIDHDPNKKVVFSKLLTTNMSSGDADDFAKIIIDTPNKPLIDIELHSVDAYSSHSLKLIGTRGTYKASNSEYTMKYIVEGENIQRPVTDTFIEKADKTPAYCSEKLVFHEESGSFGGTAFDLGTNNLYDDLYYLLTENRPMRFSVENARDVVGVAQTVHAMNHLEMKY